VTHFKRGFFMFCLLVLVMNMFAKPTGAIWVLEPRHDDGLGEYLQKELESEFRELKLVMGSNQEEILFRSPSEYDFLIVSYNDSAPDVIDLILDREFDLYRKAKKIVFVVEGDRDFFESLGTSDEIKEFERKKRKVGAFSWIHFAWKNKKNRKKNKVALRKIKGSLQEGIEKRVLRVPDEEEDLPRMERVLKQRINRFIKDISDIRKERKRLFDLIKTTRGDRRERIIKKRKDLFSQIKGLDKGILKAEEELDLIRKKKALRGRIDRLSKEISDKEQKRSRLLGFIEEAKGRRKKRMIKERKDLLLQIKGLRKGILAAEEELNK